ncbi:hypothetical protein [Pleionea mediterranea]|nr:hypothetical protein [Pleionea mediterranea]
MVLLKGSGGELIVSHLPLFHRPHDYQIIYRVEASNNQLRQLDFLSAEQDDLITLVPNKFDLMRLINKEQFNITVDVFRGHFERGGTKLFQTNITFKSPLFIRKINAFTGKDKPTSPLSKEQFKKVTINNNQELWVHLIDRQPSFDALVFNKKVERNKKPFGNHSSEKDTTACTGDGLITRINISKLLVNCFKQAPSYIEVNDFK